MIRLLHFTFLVLFLFTGNTLTAQQQSLDVLSFTVPKGWQQKKVEGGMQLVASDQSGKSYAIAVLTNAVPSNASAADNFSNRWTSSVKNIVTVKDEPTMSAPGSENGWEIISGSANYTEGNNRGAATLLTATGYGQTLSVVIMTNSSLYQDAIISLINSLKLDKPKNITAIQPAKPNMQSPSLVGLWVDYTVETNGYVNGFPQLTAGYFRREYLFKQDGTYIFRAKDFSVYMKDILFLYETGTWKVNGNQLIITPTTGKGGWWRKAASGRTSEWGSLNRASDYKPEPVTYRFELHYYSGSKDTALLLDAPTGNSRERGSRDASKSYSWSYSPRATDKSLIDNPPGFVIPN